MIFPPEFQNTTNGVSEHSYYSILKTRGKTLKNSHIVKEVFHFYINNLDCQIAQFYCSLNQFQKRLFMQLIQRRKTLRPGV